jgi:acyl-[acyl carrier protein]--UDP-N-acetylglucosamine O-acyltransferase
LQILRQLQENKIHVYDFPLTENPEVDWMREQLPFAVVGSNTIIEVSDVLGSNIIIQINSVVGSSSVIGDSALVGLHPYYTAQFCCGLQ